MAPLACPLKTISCDPTEVVPDAGSYRSRAEPEQPRDAVVRIDLAGLRSAAYEIPKATQVGRKFGLPGGGLEMLFSYAVPSEFVKAVTP